MKRALIQNVKVTPYTSEDVINREGFLSAVLGVLVGTPTGTPTGMAVKLTVTESDEEAGSYTPAADKLIPIDKALDADGAISVDTDAAGGALLHLRPGLRSGPGGLQAVRQDQVRDRLHRRLHSLLHRYRGSCPGRRFRGPRLIWP